MKNIILCALVVVCFGIISCSNSSNSTASGSGDFSSLTPNATYDNENFNAYSRVRLDASHAFTRYEVREVNGVQTECTVQGTWTLLSGEDSPATGNAVQVTGVTVNGVAVADVVYPVGQLTDETLNIQLGTNESSVDLANSNLTSYPDFQSLNPSSLPASDFCKPQ